MFMVGNSIKTLNIVQNVKLLLNLHKFKMAAIIQGMYVSSLWMLSYRCNSDIMDSRNGNLDNVLYI